MNLKGPLKESIRSQNVIFGGNGSFGGQVKILEQLSKTFFLGGSEVIMEEFD